MSFLKSRQALALTLLLLLQGAVFYVVARRAEHIPVTRPLAEFPIDVNGWRMVQEIPMEKDVADVLKADDTINRYYLGPDARSAASLFVAFFKTQRTGQAPHSPKNCLPGAGWEPSRTGFMEIAVEGQPRPITVNRYIVSRGEDKSVVLYWYQSHNRVIASEYSAKIWLVADSIRYHRSDTALVRVVVPVRGGDENAATAAGVAFIQAIFGKLKTTLPA